MVPQHQATQSSPAAPAKSASELPPIADITWLAESVERVAAANGWQQGDWEKMARMLERVASCDDPELNHAPCFLYAHSLCLDNICA